MCSDIKNSCATLIDSDGISSWESGVSEIATVQTFDTIISSCTQVGRNCIVQACKSISGNFELCDDMDFSANRHAILERTACWPDVMECVAAAGDDTLVEIMTELRKNKTGSHKYSFYSDLYSITEPIKDLCSGKCDTLTAECAKCRITERIWGNCEEDPATAIKESINATEHNHIRMPKSGDISTLLSWFAINTGTANSITNTSMERSCINTRCTTNNYATNSAGTQICLSDNAAAQRTNDGMYCSDGTVMQVDNNTTNCCFNSGNVFGHEKITDNACCTTGNYKNGICLPTNESYFGIILKKGNSKIICIGSNTISVSGSDANYPNGQTFNCNGRFILITDDNQYNTLSPDNTIYTPKMYYYQNNQHSTETPLNGQDAWFIGYSN